MLGHRHDDEAWWSAQGETARTLQRERVRLRWLANLLHVERATRRGRSHGTHASVDAQRAWLARAESAHWGFCLAGVLGVLDNMTLAQLREHDISVPSWAPLQSW